MIFSTKYIFDLFQDIAQFFHLGSDFTFLLPLPSSFAFSFLRDILLVLRERGLSSAVSPILVKLLDELSDRSLQDSLPDDFLKDQYKQTSKIIGFSPESRLDTNLFSFDRLSWRDSFSICVPTREIASEGFRP